jgi:hypothetical protein
MPMSTILLIMLPKVVANFKRMHGWENNSSPTRGSHGGHIRVSGIPDPTTGGGLRSSDINGVENLSGSGGS